MRKRYFIIATRNNATTDGLSLDDFEQSEAFHLYGYCLNNGVKCITPMVQIIENKLTGNYEVEYSCSIKFRSDDEAMSWCSKNLYMFDSVTIARKNRIVGGKFPNNGKAIHGLLVDLETGTVLSAENVLWAPEPEDPLSPIYFDTEELMNYIKENGVSLSYAFSGSDDSFLQIR